MYESITSEELKNLLIKKHKELFEKYGEDYSKIKNGKEKEIKIKKRVEILPDKKDILQYWTHQLEDEMTTLKGSEKGEVISTKIQEYRDQIKKADDEFTLRLEELKMLESEEAGESKETWLLKRVESHKKALSFWENFDTTKMLLD